MTTDVTDSVCVELGCAYDATYRINHPDYTPQDLIEKSVVPTDQYKFYDWDNIKKEIGGHIKELHNDEIELGHYIRGILLALEDPLILFYPGSPNYGQTVFQRLVPIFTFIPKFETLPDYIVEIHKEDIENSILRGTEVAPDNPEQALKERCDYTLRKLQKIADSPYYKQCRYFHLYVFKRLASIIESYLLEYHCKKDLFAYQKECGVVLYPSLKAGDIANERNLSVEYVVSNWTDGYMILDPYTEFAGYGKGIKQISLLGIKYSGIPEVDALFQNIKQKERFYPEHHFAHNYRQFYRRCQEVAESDIPLEKKRDFIVNLILIFGQCYKAFLKDQVYDLLSHTTRLFIGMEVSFLSASTPICIKDFCQDLNYGFLLEDHFPETEKRKERRERGEFVPEGPWEPYMLDSCMVASKDYYKSRVCSACNRPDCKYRFAPNPTVFERGQREKALTKTDQRQLFEKYILAVCDYLVKKEVKGIKKVKHQQKWVFGRNSGLCAYMAVAITRKFGIPSISWQTLCDIITVDGDTNYLSKMASKYKSVLEGKDKKTKLPSGYLIVNDALDSMAA